jgi:hypothetical protein
MIEITEQDKKIFEDCGYDSCNGPCNVKRVEICREIIKKNYEERSGS